MFCRKEGARARDQAKMAWSYVTLYPRPARFSTSRFGPGGPDHSDYNLRWYKVWNSRAYISWTFESNIDQYFGM